MEKQQKKNKGKLIGLIAVLLVIVVIGFIACSEDEPEDAGTGESQSGNSSVSGSQAVQSGDAGSWAFYVYMCGSDLESEAGCATADLEEMMAVDLPENVKVIIQTGGASAWYNDFVEAGQLGRYLYDSNGMQELDQLPDASMGASSTLADFLKFAYDAYPADRRGVIFWNHGGGSVLGVCSDEVFDGDILTLDEIYQAFSEASPVSEENPPFEMVGFDACLMATVDTAYTLCDVSRYLVGSEEVEPGGGWFYEGWLSALAENPGMDGAQLGTVICDTYAEQCDIDGVSDEITLSVTDLTKSGPLFEAYEAIGKEALAAACANPAFFAEFGRSANKAENYGGNTPDTGYTNMVDLYDLVNQSQSILPEHAQAVMKALEDCVVYRVNGPYRSRAAGLSAYYSYNRDEEDYEGYCNVSATEAFPYLYGYAINGKLDSEGMSYIQNIGYGELQEVPVLTSEDGTEFPVSVNEDGNAVMELSAETMDMLTGIYFQLVYVDEEEDTMLLLGRDNNIEVDWEQGIVKDNFWGEWGSIDGNLCYMEIVYEGEDYDLYSVPVLLNGEEYNLRVAYDYNKEEYQILGARKGLEESGGIADRNLQQLKPGDEITTIHYLATASGDDDFQAVDIDTFTVNENTSFYPTEMGDGTFLMYFELEDIQANTAYSQNIQFTVENGEIMTEVVE